MLKGDVPYLVSKDSSDVWLNQRLFKLELDAGAPPDYFSADGQNWGLPLYNWSEMEKDGFRWWKTRLEIASRYFQIYRIDHIVGFFRVWGVPKGQKATHGSFDPAEADQWMPQGEKLLTTILKECTMLPIGEDLGSVPSEVRIALQHLGICGTKVVRWERKWEEQKQPFIPVTEFNADSMTTVSTHDTETLSLWWQQSPEEVAAYCEHRGWKYSKEALTQSQRRDILSDSHKCQPVPHQPTSRILGICCFFGSCRSTTRKDQHSWQSSGLQLGIQNETSNITAG